MYYYLLTWALVVGVAIWFYYKKKFAYFRNHSINHFTPDPFIGNIGKVLMQKEHMATTVEKLYRAFPNDRFVGNYDFVNPIVQVRDPELIKKITVKDFDHFTDHRNFSLDDDPFFPNSLFGMKGSMWRDMRSTLSPAFTASKLRSMIPFMHECIDNLLEYLRDEAKKNGGVANIDARDISSRFTNDVIATCAFGFKINSIKDRDNEFYKMGDNFTSFGIIESIKVFAISAFPFLKYLIRTSFVAQKPLEYLSNIFLSTMKNREKNNIYRPDMLQLMLAAKQGNLTHDSNAANEKDAGFSTAEEANDRKSGKSREWSDSHMVAQALLFFFAGFDTVSTAMVFMLHELAINPKIQQKLREEIDEVYDSTGGKITYDKLNELKYLDMCFSETLRKWPPAITTDRATTKVYNMGKPYDNAPEYHMPAGKIIMIPVGAIHMDEKYHPNPEHFDPERFSDENKHNIKPFTYMPFGLGPRNCIGSRFAISEVKLMAFYMIRHFEVLPAPSTVVPLRISPKSLSPKLEGGHHLRLKLRQI